MTDSEMIKQGKSIDLYNTLIAGDPLNIMRRINALDQKVADMFAGDIGDEKLDELQKRVTSEKIAESILSKPENELTPQDWADLRATDF